MFLKKLSLLLLLAIGNNIFAQAAPEKDPEGTITGEVHDANTKAPIEYANLILYKSNDSTQVTGTITDKSGKFTLSGVSQGNYYMNVHFIGYEKKRINNISIKPQDQSINLGSIIIQPTAYNLKSVTVNGERSPVTYQIDKKVIDVSKMGTVVSGNAAEVLENVPSVSVDIEGNVSLRGSGSFTVLVDGRPSVLNNQEILQQIPASSIQSIEIVTNPSAKYDPAGTAGIINIVLKKNQNYGLSGVFNGNAGLNKKYGGNFLFEYSTVMVKYTFGLDYNNRTLLGNARQEKRFYLNDITSYVNSNGNNDRAGNSYGLRGNIDFNFGKNDFLGFGGRYGSRENLDNGTENFAEWSSNNPQQFLYTNKNSEKRSGTYYALNMNYLHKFNNDKHELSGELFYSSSSSDQFQLSNESNNNVQFSGKKSTESEPGIEFEGKIDYTLPLGGEAKFEAGSEGEMESGEVNNGLYDFNPATGIYEFQQKYNTILKSNLGELALYSIYSDKWGGLGVQGGVRSEYTYRDLKLNTTGQKFSIDRWDYFPTFHTSYNFTEATQLMASYTRRIERPQDWQLEPAETWINSKNVRRGNPSLKPELIDSYELGLKTLVGGISISNEFYYRFTHDKINYISSVYPGSDDIILGTRANVGTDYSLGAEFMLVADPLNFWNINLMGNLYNYKIDGELDNISFAKESFSWGTRLNNIFSISKSTQMQLNVRYNSPTVSSQGKTEGYFTSDVSVKQDLFEKVLSLTLQVRDIFKTGKQEYTSEGIDFYNYSHSTREAPVVMLNIRYNFSTFQNNDGDRQDGPQDNGGFEGGE